MPYGVYDQSYYERTKDDPERRAKRRAHSKAWYERIRVEPARREAYRKYQRDYYAKNFGKAEQERQQAEARKVQAE